MGDVVAFKPPTTSRQAFIESVIALGADDGARMNLPAVLDAARASAWREVNRIASECCSHGWDPVEREEFPLLDTVDADHRRVDVLGDFDRLREIMFAANASAVKYYPNKGQVLRGNEICFFERLSDLHPCDRHAPRLGLAFECLIFRMHTDWITDVDLWQLRNGVGVLEEDMTPKRIYVHRWHDWRLRENDLLRRRRLL